MMNLKDSMGGTTPINKKRGLGYDLQQYLEEARDLYGYSSPACPEGQRMVFGVCREIGETKGEKDFDSTKKTGEEEKLEAAAANMKSDTKNNTKVKVGNKTYGWAVKNGKPVLVEWGSVAGEKKATAKPKKEGK